MYAQPGVTHVTGPASTTGTAVGPLTAATSIPTPIKLIGISARETGGTNPYTLIFHDGVNASTGAADNTGPEVFRVTITQNQFLTSQGISAATGAGPFILAWPIHFLRGLTVELSGTGTPSYSLFMAAGDDS